MDEMRDSVQGWLEAAQDSAPNFSEQEIRLVRARGQYTPELTRKFMSVASALMSATMLAHTGNFRPPTLKELPNTFMYRNALAGALYYFQWLEMGGQLATRPEKIRNDLVDTIIATYATYFDGILSSDKKLQRLLREMNFLVALVKSNIEEQMGDHAASNRFQPLTN